MDKTLIIGILLMIGAAQGLLLVVVLLSFTGGNKSANRILAGLLILFSLMLFFHASSGLQNLAVDKTSHELFAKAVFSLFAPLIFCYVRALTQPSNKLQWKDLWAHLSLFIIILLLSSVFSHFSLPFNFSEIRQINFLITGLLTVQMIIYLYFSLRLLQSHQRKIKETFSALEKINLHWLYFLVGGQLVIWPAAFFTEILGGDARQWDWVWLLIAIFIYAMGYFGLRQPAIFSGRYENPAAVLTAAIGGKRKYEKSVLSAEDAEKIAGQLQERMSEQKLYLNCELSLPELAHILSVSTHHLSQILNERLGKNFFEYINGMRVDESKRLLKDQKRSHLSIAGIAQEAGFNSLSAFNTIFKKFTGRTPSNYRNTEQ